MKRLEEIPFKGETGAKEGQDPVRISDSVIDVGDIGGYFAIVDPDLLVIRFRFGSAARYIVLFDDEAQAKEFARQRAPRHSIVARISSGPRFLSQLPSGTRVALNPAEVNGNTRFRELVLP